MTISIVRARIDEHLKSKAKSVLASMGLSVSDAIRLTLIRVVADQAFPFPLKVPNAETAAAMETARRGADRESVETLTDLWTALAQEQDECADSNT